MRERAQSGFSLVEMLVSMTVLMLALGGLTSLLIQNSRINKGQRMAAETQANARNTLSMVVQKLRSAGWDPRNSGTFPAVNTDADLTDDVSEIEIFADLDEDTFTNSQDEQILIRHLGSSNQVVWRLSNDVSDPFDTVSANISNDADGNGTPEPMFVPNANPPTRITVTVTARSPAPDPTTRRFIRYTVSSDVVLRKNL